eukprot:TRINITY_DN78667_c0_g1_i1.p1 TRINITY_DN78667_c0_g1~~TRINITY_DN78667_c0_g1_i1.p1  ORF type:complete len:489 (-),score=91.31 TRINITY_DN78667_c0_g1_i1:56-1429(-)
MVATVNSKHESLDSIIEGNATYFGKHDFCSLLEVALTRLAQEQPTNPVVALQEILAERSVQLQQAAETRPAPSDEGGDFALPLDQGLDGFRLLLEEQLPGSGEVSDLSKKRLFAGGFSRCLLEGWVPQPSPCCGAASTAGAFNALWDLGRGAECSVHIREVADLMAQHCEKLCSQRQQRLERLLGLPEGALQDVLHALDAELAARGMVWTKGSGPEAVTRKTAMDALRCLLDMPDKLNPATCAALREALCGLDSTSSSDTVEETGDLPSGGMLIQTSPDWDQEFGELLMKRKAVHRLKSERPNTGEIGSWGIKQAAEDLCAARGLDSVRIQTLLGRKGGAKVLFPVAKDDNEANVEQQWSALKASFSNPNSVLIFHLTNHYALIFAWREWQDADGGDEQARPRISRQILTAREGQRPTAWLDFEEARKIMLGWSGYHMLQLQRAVSPRHINPSRAGA